MASASFDWENSSPTVAVSRALSAAINGVVLVRRAASRCSALLPRISAFTSTASHSERFPKIISLSVCISNHSHERMTMEPLPGSSLEVIELEFLFQLLVGLFANPSRFDRGS